MRDDVPFIKNLFQTFFQVSRRVTADRPPPPLHPPRSFQPRPDPPPRPPPVLRPEFVSPLGVPTSSARLPSRPTPAPPPPQCSAAARAPPAAPRVPPALTQGAGGGRGARIVGTPTSAPLRGGQSRPARVASIVRRALLLVGGPAHPHREVPAQTNHPAQGVALPRALARGGGHGGPAPWLNPARMTLPGAAPRRRTLSTTSPIQRTAARSRRTSTGRRARPRGMPWYPRPRAWFMGARTTPSRCARRTPRGGNPDPSEIAAGAGVCRRTLGSGRWGGRRRTRRGPRARGLGEFGPVVGLVVEPVEEDEGVPRRGGGGGVHGGVRG